jgi:hypothetical protein
MIIKKRSVSELSFWDEFGSNEIWVLAIYPLLQICKKQFSLQKMDQTFISKIELKYWSEIQYY